MAKYGMVIDLNKCVGCEACVVACKTEWNVPEGFSRDWVHPILPEGKFPVVESAFYVGLCNHCDNPTCIPACPTGATYKDEKGRVRVDYDLCIGCGMCVEACPYGARYANPITQKVDKCDLCANRVDNNLLPACVETCIADARIFGDLEDKNSQIHQIVFGRETKRLVTPEVNIGPNVYYVDDGNRVELILSKFPPQKKKTEPPFQGRMWSKILKPLLIFTVAAGFLGQGVAFFYQLFKGEPKVED